MGKIRQWKRKRKFTKDGRAYKLVYVTDTKRHALCALRKFRILKAPSRMVSVKNPRAKPDSIYEDYRYAVYADYGGQLKYLRLFECGSPGMYGK